MKKQVTGTLAATAALLAIAGIAQAAPFELNIFGASAQYSYWNEQAANYANTKLGCPTANITKFNTPDGKHGLVRATGCSSSLIPTANAGAIDIRYSGIASAEGPLSVGNFAPIDAALKKNIVSYTGKVPNYGTTVCANPGERAMADSASTASCHKVHLGTSDVAAENLAQTSKGQKLGPLGGGQLGLAADDFYVKLPAIDTTGLAAANTVVVPFGFFVNSSVTAKTCTSGLTGNYCGGKNADGVAFTPIEANAMCNTAPASTDGVCGDAKTIDNISREEATIIFSGVVTDWSDLGSYFTPNPLVACLRHAGSGTHSAFDLTVMNSAWGANVVTDEAAGQVYFNQGSSDMMKCINGATSTALNGSMIGAIGYADADQAVGVPNVSQNVKQLKYNGFYPTRTAIRNGLYDFYTNAWMYTNPANGAQQTIADDMIVYAQDPANVPPTKKNYWAATGEMKFNRSFDNSYPAYVGGASLPMYP